MKAHPLIALLLASLWILPGRAMGQAPALSLTGQPSSYVLQGAFYKAKGYGKARFGMSVEQVKAIIAAEFPGAIATLKDQVDPVDRTRGLAIVVPSLPPSPGTATISYVFGATSHRLITVTVSWELDGNPSDDDRQRLVQAGTVLTAGLVGYMWPPLATVRGQVPGAGALILFSGKDEAGGGVEIRLDGMALDIERPADAAGKRVPPIHQAAPSGPARLRISYVANVDRPDIYRIPAGAF